MHFMKHSRALMTPFDLRNTPAIGQSSLQRNIFYFFSKSRISASNS